MELVISGRDERLTPDTLSGSGRVHSVFRSSVNLLLDNGCFCTLLSPVDDTGPGGIILKSPVEFNAPCWALERGRPISADMGRLNLGRIRVDASRGKTFSCSIPPADTAVSAQDALKALGRLERALGRLECPVVPDGPLPAELRRRAGELERALTHDPSSVEEAVERLVGLGLGLTPSGDDMLTGVLSALWYCRGPEDQGVKRLSAAIGRCLGRTDFISARMLEAACRGRVRGSLIRLLGVLFGADREEELPAALEAVLSFGASSGRDTVNGLLSACRVLCDNSFSVV